MRTGIDYCVVSLTQRYDAAVVIKCIDGIRSKRRVAVNMIPMKNNNVFAASAVGVARMLIETDLRVSGHARVLSRGGRIVWSTGD